MRRLGILAVVFATLICGLGASRVDAQVTDPYTGGITQTPVPAAGAAAAESDGLGSGSASGGAKAARTLPTETRRGFARTGMDLLPWILIALLCIALGRILLNESNRKRRKIAQRRKTCRVTT